jgi:hypothetical protein
MNISLAQDFVAAAQWSRKMRETFLSHFYGKYSVDGRYVYIDKSSCSTLLQKELAVDTIMQWPTPHTSICIEEKIVQWPGYKYMNFALETESCTVPGRERGGWMRYAEADYLLYAFAYENDSGLDIYLIDFPKLRGWFWNLPVRYESHTMKETINHTRFEKVPIKDVVQAVLTARYLCTSEGCTFIPKRGSQ